MAVVRLTGTLQAGPVGGSECSIPGAVTSISVGTAACSKTAAAQYRSGGAVSLAVYTAIVGIGVAADVKKCDFLYLKCTGSMLARFTTADPGGGADVVAVLPVQGLVILEFPSNGYLKLLELKGSGDIEIFASSAQS